MFVAKFKQNIGIFYWIYVPSYVVFVIYVTKLMGTTLRGSLVWFFSCERYEV